jgi:hypothetical protein
MCLLKQVNVTLKGKMLKMQLALQLRFEIAMTICNSCNSMYFYGCECYQTSCMNYNGCNSLYVKLYTYVTHAIQLQLCRNNYYAILMQLACNYNGNIIFMLPFIDPSKFDMWHYRNFYITTKGVTIRQVISLVLMNGT